MTICSVHTFFHKSDYSKKAFNQHARAELSKLQPYIRCCNNNMPQQILWMEMKTQVCVLTFCHPVRADPCGTAELLDLLMCFTMKPNDDWWVWISRWWTCLTQPANMQIRNQSQLSVSHFKAPVVQMSHLTNIYFDTPKALKARCMCACEWNGFRIK